MTTSPKPLNKIEVWVAERSAPIFVTLAVLILLGAIAVFYVYERSSHAEDQVNRLRPQVTKINRAVCDSRSLESERKAARCAERIRVGLINCRRSQPCRAALLAAITYPPPAHPITTAPDPEGGATQNPSTPAGQQPGPGSPGHHGSGDHHGGDGDQGAEPEAAPSPSPAPSSSPASNPSPSPETPASGAQGGQQGASPSGVGVEVCALEGTCVGIDLHPKGLNP